MKNVQTLEQAIEQAKQEFAKSLIYRQYTLPEQEKRREILARKFTGLGIESTKKTRQKSNKSASAAKTKHYGAIQNREYASTGALKGHNIPLPPYVQGTAIALYESGFSAEQIKHFAYLCGTKETLGKVQNRFRRFPKKAKQLPQSREYVNSYHEQLSAIL